jgi:F420 biosynthesis protein FbiB-like protein
LTNIDLHEFLRSRRSIRRFKPDLIPETVIQRILTTATYAPSAHNRQPWRFTVIKSSAVKSRLAEAMGADFRRDLEKDKVSESEINHLVNRSCERINAAPVIVVLCADATDMDVYPDNKRKQAEYMMTVQSVANAGTQLLLAIHAEGLGAVWTCSPLFTPDVVRSALELPKTWEPQAMFLVGYADKLPINKELKQLDEVSIWL